MATAPVLGTGLTLMLLLGWVVVARGLKPLHKLQQEVESISSSNMTPVTIPEMQELEGIATTLNDMIENLKEAFERERRFTANVAHELRTRISEMRSLSEVALRLDDSIDEPNRRNYEDILASAKEMQQTVTNLLTLARCHSGQLKPQKDSVNLDQLISSIWKELQDKASERELGINFDVPPDLNIVTDKDLLRTILQNLLSNAVSYVTRQGKIELKADIRDGDFYFSISNSVEDFLPTDLPHLFEPFWRKDKARSSGNTHSGLGLALVQSLAEILGLLVNADLTSPDFLAITLSEKTDHSTQA